MCASKFGALPAGSVHCAPYQVLPAPLMHFFWCATARHASMLLVPGMRACVLLSGALLDMPSCALYTMFMLLCFYTKLLQMLIASGWLFRPCRCQASSIPLLCACSVTLYFDYSVCCMRWMTSVAQLSFYGDLAAAACLLGMFPPLPLSLFAPLHMHALYVSYRTRLSLWFAILDRHV